MFTWFIAVLKFRISGTLIKVSISKGRRFFPMVPAKIQAKHSDMPSTSRVIYPPPPSKKKEKCKMWFPRWPLCSLVQSLSSVRFNFQFESCVSLEDHAPYCELWHVWLYCIYPHRLINGTIFEKIQLEDDLIGT